MKKNLLNFIIILNGMKKNIAFVTLLVFLFSCTWSWESIITNNTKKEFLIETIPYYSFTNNTIIKKVWKIEWSQDLKISSQANGRVSKIYVKEWQKVVAGQTLATLQDSIANYGIALERAKNWLERARLNYDSSSLSLDKQIFDTELSLEKLTSNYEAVKKNIALDISQAEDTLKNTNSTNANSKSSLQLDQLSNSIAKSELDYDNKLIADNESIEWFKSTFKKENNSLVFFLWDIIDFWDKLFGVTNKYENEARLIEDFFWWKDVLIRNQTETDLLQLISYNTEKLLKIDTLAEMDNTTFLNNLDVLELWYEYSKNYLNHLEETLTQSIPSFWTLSESQISSYISSINAYQAQLQWNYAAFLTYSNSASSFIRTYKNTQASLLKQIELQKNEKEILEKTLSSSELLSETGYSKIITTSDDTLKSLEIQMKSTKHTLENLKQSKEITLQSLSNTIREAEISVSAASKEYEKLTVTAPISWVIDDIMIDVWTDVANGTPLLTLVWTNNTEVQIAFTENELHSVEVWMDAYIVVWWKRQKATIYSISSVADQNLNFKANIALTELNPSIWWIVDVEIPIQSDFPLIPLNYIEIGSGWTGNIRTFIDWKIEVISVALGRIYSDRIEILGISWSWELLPETTIIFTDVSNYDMDNYELKVLELK